MSDDVAIIQTVDFFTPIVDDPYWFGQIAAANALSDVYAMGGRPLTAMNIVCFPIKTMAVSILKDILAGGMNKVHEAGAALVGGHSVEDPELKYGLSVTGTIHPGRVVLNRGARAGDRLVLTKPLGTGIISTALKNGKADQAAVSEAMKSMGALNRKASELMQETGVNACTDVTGFGLLGHACEMVEGSETGMIIDSAAVPVLPQARELAGMGMLPGGLQRNRDFRQCMVEIDRKVPADLADILFDPQTSGGLLISLPGDKAGRMLEKLREARITEAAMVGEVTGGEKGRITVR